MSALLCENFTVIAWKITETEACKDSYVPGAAAVTQASAAPPTSHVTTYTLPSWQIIPVIYSYLFDWNTEMWHISTV